MNRILWAGIITAGLLTFAAPAAADTVDGAAGPVCNGTTIGVIMLHPNEASIFYRAVADGCLTYLVSYATAGPTFDPSAPQTLYHARRGPGHLTVDLPPGCWQTDVIIGPPLEHLPPLYGPGRVLAHRNGGTCGESSTTTTTIPDEPTTTTVPETTTTVPETTTTPPTTAPEATTTTVPGVTVPTTIATPTTAPKAVTTTVAGGPPDTLPFTGPPSGTTRLAIAGFGALAAGVPLMLAATRKRANRC